MGRTQRKRAKRKNQNIPPDKLHSSSNLPALYQHLHANGWKNLTNLTVRNFSETGRGICSKSKTIASGDELIRLPVRCLLTIATIEADVDFKSLFDRQNFNLDNSIPFQSLMSFYLIYHQHLQSCHVSAISSYLASLPVVYNTPFFCSIRELECLPEAILEQSASQNRKIRQSYLNLKNVLAESQCCIKCGKAYFSNIFSIADFRNAYFAVNTRSVYLNSQSLKSSEVFFQNLLNDNTNLALAPFLDLFNHSDIVETKSELLVNPECKEQLDFVITLPLTLPIPPYSQLFISYGTLPNIKLLTDYGFILTENSHDYFEFSLLDIENLIKFDKLYQTQTFHSNKFKFIREHCLNDQMFVHLSEGCSHNLQVVLFLIFHQRSHFSNDLSKIAFGEPSQFELVHRELEALVSFKMIEYHGFADALLKLPELSRSGKVAHDYILECIRYLKDFQKLYCA